MPILSFSEISNEFIGEPMTNQEAINIIKTQREYAYQRFVNYKQSDNIDFKRLIMSFKEIMAYDILINNFEKYLSQEQ